MVGVLVGLEYIKWMMEKAPTIYDWNIFHFYYKLKFVLVGASYISAFDFKNVFNPLHCSCHTKADWIEKLLSLFELVIVSNFSTLRIYFHVRKLASNTIIVEDFMIPKICKNGE